MYLKLKKTENTQKILQEFGKRDINGSFVDYENFVTADFYPSNMNGYLAYVSVEFGYIQVHNNEKNDTFNIPLEEVLVIYNI